MIFKSNRFDKVILAIIFNNLYCFQRSNFRQSDFQRSDFRRSEWSPWIWTLGPNASVNVESQRPLLSLLDKQNSIFVTFHFSANKNLLLLGISPFDFWQIYIFLHLHSSKMKKFFENQEFFSKVQSTLCQFETNIFSSF